jgi:hypothetical protein
MFITIINYIYTFVSNIKNKSHVPILLNKIFTKGNIIKVIVIFSVGLVSRIFISKYYDVNVFIEYYKSISLIYYSLMAIFIVALTEVFTYIDFNILPAFLFEYTTRFSNSLRHITTIVWEIKNNIYYLLSKTRGMNLSDFLSLFTIRSITSNLIWVCQEVTNIFNHNKLTINSSEPFDKYNKAINPVKISNVFHKNGDNFVLPKTTYKPLPSASQQASSSLQVNETAGARRSSTSLGKSDRTLPFVLHVSADENREIETLENTVRNQLRSSSIYSNDSVIPRDAALYQDSLNSNFATPKTMTPLFSGSPRTSDISNISPNGYPLSASALASPSNYPAPLAISSNRINSAMPSPTLDNSSDISRSNVSNPSYLLSGNGVLPNVAFSRVAFTSNNIPLDGQNSYNRTLPGIPVNHERTMDDITANPVINDPCSFNYKSRHRNTSSLWMTRAYRGEDYPYIGTEVNTKVSIKKPGIVGKVRLGFKTLGSKFTNGLNKIESAYIHYETVGKRHIIWSLFEENRGSYDSYEDFKKEWDSNTSLWNEIKQRTKKDLKADIEDLMGIRGNKPTVTGNLNREVEDLLHRKRPFARPTNNPITNTDNNVTEEPNTSQAVNKTKSRHHHPNRNRKHSNIRSGNRRK